ncbi:MAG: YbjN domain-containing protein [Solirubrobacterales bacterium]|nr:YbjN domain-containing protein [Solirubrobacterales bacterium]
MPAPAAAVVEAYLASLAASFRTLGDDAWGLSVEAAGDALHIGLALRRGLLRAQAPVLAAGRVTAAELLLRNRGLRLVRYTHGDDGTVWVEGDLPPEAVSPKRLDELLGSLVAAATVARERAVGGRPEGA